MSAPRLAEPTKARCAPRRPDDLAAIAIKGALASVPQMDAREIEDVILGCAMPEAEQGMNVARIASLRAGLPVETSAMTINRFCSSGLQAIAMAAERIMAGGAEVIVAGGTESMSMIPMGGHKISANPWLVANYPDAYLSMGLTAERVARHYGITREQADEFCYQSHQKALRAMPPAISRTRSCRFRHLHTPAYSAGRASPGRQVGNRADRLQRRRRPARRYHAGSSGRAQARIPCQGNGHGRQFLANVRRRGGAMVMSAEKARQLGIKPLARYVAFATAGCKPEEMGLGPVYAIPKALKMAGLSLADIDCIELNEAFAAQSLAVIGKRGSIPPRSISTAAPSRSGTRWAAPARSSRPPFCANSSAATAATAWSPCVWAAAWARRAYSRICN